MKHYIEMNGKYYSSTMRHRLTDCCAAYSKPAGQVRVCKACLRKVREGEGDGHEQLLLNEVSRCLMALGTRSDVNLSSVNIDEFGDAENIRVAKRCKIALMNGKDGTLILGDIVVSQRHRSKGIGHSVLNVLTDYADTNNVVLKLNAFSHSKGPMTTRQVRDWYLRHGFKLNMDGLVRMPVTKTLPKIIQTKELLWAQ